MPSKLISGSVWGRIRKLSQCSTPALVAVPYFGSGASNLLKFREGSLLVVKFDREAVSSGQVDPREIVKLIRRGVEVHSCSNLHAKVFVFGGTVVIGSSNVSRNSENNLLEACVETTEKTIVLSAKRFIRSLQGDAVGLDYAKQMIPFYRPPTQTRQRGSRTKAKRSTPNHSDLWLTSLVQGRWRDEDYEQEEIGRPAARKAMSNPRSSVLESFQWAGNGIQRFKKGQRVLQCIKSDNETVTVSPPSRITGIRKYTLNGKKRAIVFLERPKKYRDMRLKSFVARLGSSAKKLGNPRRSKQIKDPELIYNLGRLWSK